MSETTQILFNSPALHSLKRDQLVRLCKIHSIKASGKNIDLIQRLKKHALTLPLSDPSSSEQPDDDNDVQDDLASPLDLKRPSEQWEVVMEDIQELPESSSRATLSSLRSLTSNAPDEFGAGGGSKSSSMSSSLKAIANSFNFKRAASNKPDPAQAIAVSHPMRSNITDELASHSVPYSCIPEPSLVDMPHTDYFKFSTPDTTLEEHILGQLGRPGVAALANASSSGTVGPPKTTIRLVSAPAPAPPLSPGPGTPHLKPVDPAFDLVMGSPGDKGQSRVLVWPLSPQPVPSERLYPSLPVDELDQAKQSDRKFTMPSSIAPSPSPSQAVISSASKKKMYPTPSNNVQDMFSPAPKRPGAQKDVLSIPRSEPFLFGSPLPRHSVSNDAFDAAAASVLEEMNKRLSAAGVQKVDDDVFKGSTTTVATTSASTDSGGLLALGKVDRFNKVHEEQFKKMNSIATHYAAKRGAPGSKKRKSDVLGRGLAPGRKRSSADTRVISAGSRKRMGLPGGFDDEEVVDDVQEEEDRRMSKRVRLLEENGGKDKGRRLSISPGKTAAEGKQAEKERAATRKMLESRKEKRRSSRHGRTIVAGPQAVSNKGKATPRFGFLSSAKSIVRSVWNFSAGSPAKASRTSATTVAPTKPSVKAPPPPSRPLEAQAGGKSVVPAHIGSTSSKAPKPTGDTSNASHLRPSIHGLGLDSKPNNGKSGYSRTPSMLSNTTKPLAASISSRPSAHGTKGGAGVSRSSTLNAPSFGTQRSMASLPTTSGTTKISNVPSASRAEGSSSGNKTSIFSPSGTTSRLFAPTASSLAKSRSPTGAAIKSKTSSIVAQRAKTPPRNSTLDAITNSPRGGNPSGLPPSPETTGKIFTTPFLLAQTTSVIPPPIRPTSLTAAATTLAAAGRVRGPGQLATTTVSSSSSPSSTSSASQRAPEAMTTSSYNTTQLPSRQPRISHSRIITKLGAQRAAAAASFTSGPSSSHSDVKTSGVTSRIPRASGSAVRTPRVRSSMGTAARRSYTGAKSTGRGSDVLMSAKKHARQSEYARRQSRVAGSAIGTNVSGVSRASGGLDGSIAMDIDED